MVKRKDGSHSMGSRRDGPKLTIKKKPGPMLVNKNKKKLKESFGKQKGIVTSKKTFHGLGENDQDQFQWRAANMIKKKNNSKLDMKNKKKITASSGKQKREAQFVTPLHPLAGNDKDKFQPRVPKMAKGKSGSKIGVQSKKKSKTSFGKQDFAVTSDTTSYPLDGISQDTFQRRITKMVSRLSSSKKDLKKKKNLKGSSWKQKPTVSSNTTVRPLGENDKDEVELRLEERVFGGVANMIGRLASDDDGASNSGEDSNEEANALKRKPAWQDEDDEISAKEAFRIQGRRSKIIDRVSGGYSNLLRQNFESAVGVPKWAGLDNKKKESGSDAEYDEELLQHCGKFIVKGEHVLTKGTIDMKRLKDLNTRSYAEGPIIKAVEFHPSATVGLVAGLAGIASLFQVDGTNNAMLHSTKFEAFPITCARFTRDGNNFFVGSGNHRHFYCHDLLTGKNSRIMPPTHSAPANTKTFEMSPDGQLMAICEKLGQVNVITMKSQEPVATLKINGNVTAIAFNSEGSRLFMHSNFGEVHVWDVSSRKFLHRFMDDGCIMGSSIAVSPNNQFMACGSSSGFVNLYETATAMSSASPRPLKAFPNLTTSVSVLKFNSSSQLLAMCSSEKETAIKLGHVESLTVYSNFPWLHSKIFRAQCFDFSRNSGYFAVGNNRNAALLYRLKSFANY